MPPTAACQNHPAREAVGVCVRCRAQICGECVTKVDGINHCVECYERRAGGPADRPSSGGEVLSSTLASFVAAALFLLLTALTWALLEVSLPGSGDRPAPPPSVEPRL